MKPFLKWAGNKYRIIDKICGRLPAGKRLIEPFAGSGAVFLNTEFASNMVNDLNIDLIDVYRSLQSDGPSFVDRCKQLFVQEYNTSTAYYRLREEFNASTDWQRKAVLFVYLNRHGYNGLCRYNHEGGFNVPFGRYKKPYFPFAEMMLFYHKSQSATFSSEDFETVLAGAQPGDVIYCDPPYVPLSATANFTSYSAGGFGREEQLRLVQVAEDLSARGIAVLVSNHLNEWTLNAYANAEITFFDVQRFISCDGANRAKATELLALFQPGS